MSKKSVIVPGVHDPIPPQGRVTVQLVDPDRPWRVRQEVKAENAIMDWWMSGVSPTNGFRGHFDNDIGIQRGANFSLNQAAAISHDSWARGKFGGIPGVWPGRYGSYVQHFWASSANVTPDSAKPWIPTNNTDGDLTAWACHDVAAATDATNYPERGTVVAAESWATDVQSRMTLEWSPSLGNGTWRSAGIGNVTFSITGGGVKPAPFNMYLRTPGLRTLANQNGINARAGGIQSLGTDYPPTSMHMPTANELYYIKSNGVVGSFNVATWSSNHVGVSTGLGTTAKYGIAWLNGRVWVTKRGVSNLYEYDDNLSSLTLNNTFDITANISGDTIYDITTDGTDLYLLGNSNVHKFDNTGTYVSSWAHGIALAEYNSVWQSPGLEYDPAMGHLWLNKGNGTRQATGGAVTLPWGGYYDSNDASWGSGNERVYAFSTAGSQLNYTWHPFWYISDDPYMQYTSITGVDPQGWHFWGTSGYSNGTATEYSGYAYMFSQGPSAASHAVLPSDIIKTSSDALKVVYDFDFTG